MPKPNEGNVISRYFKGKPEEASAQAAKFAAMIAPDGWAETGRTYTPGSYGCGAFLVALLLAIVIVGIFVFIYMVLVKPPGVLVVTYTKTAEPVSGQTETPRPAVEEELQQDGARTES